MNYPVWGLSTYVDVSCDILLPQLWCCRWTWRGSCSPSPSFLSVILKALLAYKCCLAQQEGRTYATRPRVCLAVWKVERVYTGRWQRDSHGKQGLKDALTHNLSQLLHSHSTSPVNTSDVCVWPGVTDRYHSSCDNYPTAFRVGLSWLLGTSVCPVTISSYCCLLFVHLSCAVRNCWLLSHLKTTHPFQTKQIQLFPLSLQDLFPMFYSGVSAIYLQSFLNQSFPFVC